jgi:hypothetical protein
MVRVGFDNQVNRPFFRSLSMKEIIGTLGYMSPYGNNLANPELVARQIQGLRHALIRLKMNQLANNTSSYLNERERQIGFQAGRQK